jgi:hypothetical protein
MFFIIDGWQLILLINYQLTRWGKIWLWIFWIRQKIRIQIQIAMGKGTYRMFWMWRFRYPSIPVSDSYDSYSKYFLEITNKNIRQQGQPYDFWRQTVAGIAT